eukprot:gb/GECG01003487.1/.p1 GENE.gb/GECG01003487.1/~~gb/GECG01003487.1/.p1  ORF type:complete len:425 (+),score=61.43 gb/GECG01003487.1/:1-1275(+)
MASMPTEDSSNGGRRDPSSHTNTAASSSVVSFRDALMTKPQTADQKQDTEFPSSSSSRRDRRKEATEEATIPFLKQKKDKKRTTAGARGKKYEDEVKLRDDMTGQEKLQTALKAFARKLKHDYETRKSPPGTRQKPRLSTLKKHILQDRVEQWKGAACPSSEFNSADEINITRTTRQQDITSQIPKTSLRDPAAGMTSPPRDEDEIYIDHPPSEQLDSIVFDMISTSLALQLKHKMKSNNHLDKRKRKIASGLREVKRDLRAGKIKFIVIARNIDPTLATHILEEEIKEIKRLAKEQDPKVPIAYSLTRRKLGKALGKPTRQSIAGFYSFEGLQFKQYDVFKLLDTLKDPAAANNLKTTAVLSHSQGEASTLSSAAWTPATTSVGTFPESGVSTDTREVSTANGNSIRKHTLRVDAPTFQPTMS